MIPRRQWQLLFLIYFLRFFLVRDAKDVTSTPIWDPWKTAATSCDCNNGVEVNASPVSASQTGRVPFSPSHEQSSQRGVLSKPKSKHESASTAPGLAVLAEGVEECMSINGEMAKKRQLKPR